MKHLTCIEDLTQKSLEDLFILADKIKKNMGAYADKLQGKIIATLFYETSTRSRNSFEAAALRLGAGVISTENARESLSAWKGESLEDTIRIISSYADAIVIRHSEDDSATRAAAVSSVPIITAGSGSASHPTQAILDVFTIREIKKRLDNITVCVMGDLRYGRTANSLIKLLSLYKGVRVYALSPKVLELTDECINFMKGKNIEVVKCGTLNDVPADIDVIYQTRLQKERLPDPSASIDEFIINKKVMERFSKDTLLMHPLPRIAEISTDVDSDPRSVYFKQAANGIPTRMALYLTIFGKG